jgi:hypothetical protein
MTISSTTVKNSYSGNGTLDTFNYTFKIFADSDLQVIIRDATATETVKTLTTHYTVTGAGSASGGTIVFTAGNIPSATETVVIRRAVPQTQAIDYIANDPFPAESHEEGLDRSMMTLQQLQEEVNRSIKLSRTNTMTSTEFTVGATNRANKVLAFDSSGEIAVTQEIGTFRGDWSASVSYQERDLIKDTTNNNIYIANTAHTSSGSLPITSNTDSAKWDLIVDAASATSSATAAASSATAAAASATAAATSETNAATSETNAATSETNAATSETNAEAAKTAAETAQAAAEAALDTFDDRFLGAKASDPTLDNDGNALQDGALYYDTTNELMKVYDLTNTVWRQLALTGTNQTNVNTVAGQISPTNNIATVAGISTEIGQVANIDSDVTTVANNETDIQTLADIEDGTVATNAISNAGNVASDITTVAGQISPTNNISTVAGIDTQITNVSNNTGSITTVATDLSGSNNIGTVATDIANVNLVGGSIANVNQVGSNIGTVNEFGERYRVASSDPTTSLDAGDLAFNTTANALKYYNGSNWEAIVAGGLTDVVQDGSPQLGGNLDVNGNSIVSVSNGNISITPDGTGKVIIDGLSHPTADGTNGQALVTNGSGVLSFDTIQASELSTEGAVFSNYNTITSNVTTTTASTKNSFLKGVITINSGFTWTISGTGSLDII